MRGSLACEPTSMLSSSLAVSGATIMHGLVQVHAQGCATFVLAVCEAGLQWGVALYMGRRHCRVGMVMRLVAGYFVLLWRFVM